MNPGVCYRCDVLARAVLATVQRHISLIGERRIAELRSDTESMATLDLQIAASAKQRDDAFSQYLSHCQSEQHAATGMGQLPLFGIPALVSGS